MKKQEELLVHCIFPDTGEDVRQLVLHSFVLYLRRILVENGGIGV